MTEPISNPSKAPIRITGHYFARQEFFRIYTTLSSGYPEGVNLAALFHAILRHPNLSRATRHIGNNWYAYVRHHITDEKMKSMRRDFDELIKTYDHGLVDAVTINTPCTIMEVYWACILSYEVMDFDIPFISLSSGALIRSVMDYCETMQDERGDLLDLDAAKYEANFSFSTPNGKQGPKLNIPQYLWDAMMDRDVAMLYTDKYIKHLVESEDTETPAPANKHLH